MIPITVGIPIAGRHETLSYLLRSLDWQRQIDGFEVLICCWGPDDFTRALEVVRATLPRASVVGLRRTGRFEEALAKNVLADLARTKWLCLLNSDIVLHPQALARALSAANAQAGSYVFSNKSKLDSDSTEKLRAGWSAKVLSQIPYEPMQRAEEVPGVDARVFGNGDFLFIDRATYMAVGGYDEEFCGWGYADQDLLRRLFLAGVRQRDLTADIRIWHQYHEREESWKNPGLSQVNRQRLYELAQHGSRAANMGRDWGLRAAVAAGRRLQFAAGDERA